MAEDRIATSTGPLMASMPRPVLQKTRPLQVQNFGLTLGQAEFDASPLIELFQLDRDTPAEVGRTKWNGTQFSADPNHPTEKQLGPSPPLAVWLDTRNGTPAHQIQSQKTGSREQPGQHDITWWC